MAIWFSVDRAHRNEKNIIESVSELQHNQNIQRMHTSAEPLFVAGHVQRYVIKSESNSMNLDKYRSLDGWKFIFDILLHKRLYAARYKDLNDPMEGYYTFASGKNVSSAYSEEISSAKMNGDYVL